MQIKPETDSKQSDLPAKKEERRQPYLVEEDQPQIKVSHPENLESELVEENIKVILEPSSNSSNFKFKHVESLPDY